MGREGDRAVQRQRLRAKLAQYALVRKLYDIYLMFFRRTHFSGRMATCHNADFVHEPIFARAFALAQTRGKCDYAWRARVACWAGKQASLLDGDFVECGVARAHLAAAIVSYLGFADMAQKRFFLFDTFRGLVDEQITDEDRGAHHNIYRECYEDVRSHFAGTPNVVLVQGVVPESLSTVEIQRVAYLSIDMNCAVPEKAALAFFWPKVVPGGIILLDDYGWRGYENQKRAHDEFAEDVGVEVLGLPTGQGLLIKPSTR